MTRYVVTGTDTGIGKTVFAAALTAALNATYWKPIQSGLDGETDSQTVARLSGRPVLPERYRLALPASPHKSAAAEKIAIDPAALDLPAVTPLVVEGAGGLLVPLNERALYADVFARWQAPVILCARTALGTINHTLLTIEAMRARAIPLHGIAFIGQADAENERIIPLLSGARRLGRLDPVSPLTRENLAAAFAAGFDIKDFP